MSPAHIDPSVATPGPEDELESAEPPELADPAELVDVSSAIVDPPTVLDMPPDDPPAPAGPCHEGFGWRQATVASTPSPNADENLMGAVSPRRSVGSKKHRRRGRIPLLESPPHAAAQAVDTGRRHHPGGMKLLHASSITATASAKVGP